jgi:hypothetical protein
MTKGALLVTLGLIASACAEANPSTGPVASAEFGIFFGGQIQERDEIPFCLDRGKQRQVLRIDFRRPLAAKARVSWELDMPAAERQARDLRGRRGPARVVKSGQTEARAGQDRLEIELPFSPGDALGTWNLRAWVADQVVVDRPFLVYDAAARRRDERRQREAKRTPTH